MLHDMISPYLPGGVRWPAQPLSHDWKFLRAYEHLETLDNEVSRWVHSDAVILIDEFDPQSGEHRKRVLLREKPPIRFGLILGDCLQNLRNVLDHLVFSLTEAALGSPVPDNIAKDICFPILVNSDATKLERCIGKIDPTAKAFIEGLQPCNGGNPIVTPTLTTLNRLANDDKHRLMHFPLFSGAGAQMTLPMIGGISGNMDESRLEIIEGPLEDGAVVMRYFPVPIDPTKEVQVGLSPVFGIAFPKGTVAEGADVVWTLLSMFDTIARRVIKPVRAFLV